MNGLSVVHWLVLTLVPLAAVGIVLAIRERAERDPNLWKRGAFALGAAGIVLLPFLIPYAEGVEALRDGPQPDERPLAFSALPKHWLTSSPTNRLWAGSARRPRGSWPSSPAS